MHRRRFIQCGLKAAAFAAFSPRAWAGTDFSNTTIDIIPSALSQAPNYWCTWDAQNYMYGHNIEHLDPKVLEGGSGSDLAEKELTENAVFAPYGWAQQFFPEIRSELYFLFDAGWEADGYATFLLNTHKFPSFDGSPEQRLKKLNMAIRDKGWRGAALWCRNTPDAVADVPLVQRSKNAEIYYWKIDGGDKEFHVDSVRNDIRAMLTAEHVYGEWPLNGNWHEDGRFGVQQWDSPRVEILKKSDVYRTYDTTPLLSIATTLDRVAQLLNAVQGHQEVRALLNVEDEVYIAAVLGCTMGIMRFPLSGLRPDGDVDLFFAGPRNAKKRMDEVVRAIHWQRIAAPYSAGAGFVRLGSETFTDTWSFRRGETWYTDAVGQVVKQGAPGRVSRNIELPKVESANVNGDKPYVCAGRFPNGAVAIATQQRTKLSDGWYMPPAVVTLDVGDTTGPIGIFGHFETLNLTFGRSLRGKRILAQDLKGGHALDITKSLETHGRELKLSGNVIARVGLSESSPGDLSDPGMVLKLI